MEGRKPVIALTPYHNIENDEPYMRPAYLKAVIAAGGIPVVLPLGIPQADLSQLAESFDAFLFCGGPDIHPFHFGQETHSHCGNVSAKRDALELALLHIAMDTEKPILGICRGIQLLNVALGGDLYQDIPSQFTAESPIAHTQPFDYGLPSHTVTVLPGTLLGRIIRHPSVSGQPPISGQTPVSGQLPASGQLPVPGHPPVSGQLPVPGQTPVSGQLPVPGQPPVPGQTPVSGYLPASEIKGNGGGKPSGTDVPSESAPAGILRVNSMHHQAVRRLAPCLAASAYAPGGLIEAIEKPDYPGFFLGVQWHPEYLWEQDAAAAGIFKGFVDAARKKH